MEELKSMLSGSIDKEQTSTTKVENKDMIIPQEDFFTFADEIPKEFWSNQ